MRTIAYRQFRKDVTKVLDAVGMGQSMVITRKGVPIAELRPASARRFVCRSALKRAARNAPRIDLRRFRADIDRGIDQSAHSF